MYLAGLSATDSDITTKELVSTNAPPISYICNIFLLSAAVISNFHIKNTNRYRIIETDTIKGLVVSNLLVLGLLYRYL